MSDTVSGFVQRVVFNSGDFNIINFFVQESDPPGADRNTTVRGNLSGLKAVARDVPIKLVGRWKNHSKYGRQFAFTSWEPWASTPDDLTYFLHTCIPGFRRSVAEAVVQQYGMGAFEKLSESPKQVLEDLAALDEDVLQQAILGWETAIATRDLSEVLKAGGLNAFEIQSVLAKFGTEASAVVKANPFRLMEVPGQNFTKIDKLAIHLGGSLSDPRRIEGAVLWSLREASRQGHLFLRRGQIPKATVDLMVRNNLASLPLKDDAPVLFAKAIQALIDREALVLEEGVGVYLPDLHAFERDSAELLAELLTTKKLEVDVEGFLEEYEKGNKITLSDAQREAVGHLADNQVLVLTGLPGTGKTTAVRAIVHLFETARLTFSLMAPTGIAAKRLSAVTGHDASTIHRALRYDGRFWRHHTDNKYVVDAVIVDEMSMVDQELFYRLISALRPDTILVLVGDDAQLPSVGAGNVLRELVNCGSVPNVRLTKIFRQSVRGEIVTNSHRINRGEMPILVDPKEETEFKFVRVSDETRIVDLITRMAKKLKSRNANFQVLSPKYEGEVGVINLNDQLRDTLNPRGPREWSSGKQNFRLGDRVMVIQNDYERNVYNGDVGKLVRINRDQLVVKIHDVADGPDMEVSFTEHAAETRLRLAYAVTVHKCQGSEFDTIILPVVKAQGRMLQRNLLYTAVTRARKKVWLIGDEAAILRAIQNDKVVKRNTAFAAGIEKCLSGVEDSHERADDDQLGSGTSERADAPTA